MKQRRRLALLLGLVVLGVLAVGCGASTGARGWAAPTRVGDLLLVSAGKGRINALDAQTREERWRFPRDWSIPQRGAGKLSGIYGAPVVSQDGSVLFLGDYNGHVYAFKPADHSTAAEEKPTAAALKLDGPVIGGVALDAAADVLIATSGQRVYKVSASNLAARIANRDARVEYAQLFQTDGEIWSTPVLSGGNVFFSSLDGNLYAIEQRTGRLVWRFTGMHALASTPAVVGDLLLVGGFDRRLHAIDISTGNEKWSFQASNWVWSRPAVDSGSAYFGDFDGFVYAIDLSSGREQWSLDLAKGTIRASPALAGGVLVVGTEDGWLVGIDVATRSPRWERELDTAVNADLVATDAGVLISPSGCVTPEGQENRVYYASVDPQTGDLRTAEGVC